jgi:hypothetical protein
MYMDKKIKNLNKMISCLLKKDNHDFVYFKPREGEKEHGDSKLKRFCKRCGRVEWKFVYRYDNTKDWCEMPLEKLTKKEIEKELKR